MGVLQEAHVSHCDVPAEGAGECEIVIRGTHRASSTHHPRLSALIERRRRCEILGAPAEEYDRVIEVHFTV